MTDNQLHDPDRLDAYETRLLAELRDLTREQGARPQAPTRRRLLAAAAAVSLVGVGVATIAVTRPAPAYALTPTADGGVAVQVKQLAGADALKADLAARGIKADVTYTKPGTVCAPGRYRPVASAANSATPPPDDAERGGQIQQAEASAGSAGQTLGLPKSLVGSPYTVVLESSWTSDNSWTVTMGLADGPVAACVEVPAPSAPTPTAGATATAVTEPAAKP